MRKALIEIATGKVANVIILDEGANWNPPAGHEVRDAEGCGPGDTWDGTKFNKAPKLAPPERPLVTLIDALLSARSLSRLTPAEKESLREL